MLLWGARENVPLHFQKIAENDRLLKKKEKAFWHILVPVVLKCAKNQQNVPNNISKENYKYDSK